MKIAIISVSDKGKDLSFKLKELLDCDSTVIRTDLYHKNVKENLPLLFDEYDAIIAIMATGILVRSIAPLLESKVTDPAVLNIDDNGNYVISTLSGHLGGANKLTEKVADLIDATPVITTATDVNHRLGVDVFAKDMYLSIDNTKEILFFNKAILEGREVQITLNSNKNFNYLFNYFTENTLEINVSMNFSSQVEPDEIRVNLDEHCMVLRERKLVLGIGCKRGKSCNEIYSAVKQSLDDLNLDVSRINMLASAEIKKDEEGILELSEKLDIPVNFVDMDKLELFESDDIVKSDFVKSKFGIWGVCEPSALIMAGFDSELIYKKTSYDGVTVAIAVSK